jgi:hypothetical protein
MTQIDPVVSLSFVHANGFLDTLVLCVDCVLSFALFQFEMLFR